jgi:hypothetical protein
MQNSAPMTLDNMRANGVRMARRRDMIRARLLTHPKSSIGGALMFQFLRGVALSAAVVLNCGAAFAEQDRASANYMMPACRDAASGNFANGESHEDLFTIGFCLGIINGINYMGTLYGICSPNGVTPQQAARVVVKYIDERPARMNENFKLLAVEALQAAWRCKN